MTLVLHQREEGELAASGEGCFFGSADFENWPFRERDGTSTATAVAAGDSVNAITTGARAARLRRLLPLPNYRLRSGRLSRRLPTWSSLDAEKNA